MPTTSELTILKTEINRLVRYIKRNVQYNNEELITALTPSEEKLSRVEGETLRQRFDDYFKKHLSMSKMERETLLKNYVRASRGTLEPLPPEVMNRVADYLPNKDEGRLSASSTTLYGLFAKTVKPRQLLTCVVEGDLKGLKALVAKNPGSIFEKGRHITTPAGETYYHLSTFQAMTFICDADMKAQIMAMVMPYMTEALRRVRQIQYAEIDSGGADLVRVGFCPTAVPFSAMQTWIDRTTHIDGITLTIPLLENRDGLIFYNDQLYYANQETKTVTGLDVHAEALAQLKPIFAGMIVNSARRSSDKEHALIKKLLKCPETHAPLALSRKGIRYVHQNMAYQDNRIEFRLPTVYRRYFKLITHALAGGGNRDPVNQFWLNEINRAQKEVLWLLQRFCEPNRPFDPVPDFSASPFVRDFEIINWRSDQTELVFSAGRFKGDFESSLVTICKGFALHGQGARESRGNESYDLAASLRLIKDGKTNVLELNSGALLQPGAPGTTL